jgi:hypothetical protein
MGDMRNVYNILVGKPEGKKLLGRPGRRWEDVNCFHLTENRDQWHALVNTVMILLVQ